MEPRRGLSPGAFLFCSRGPAHRTFGHFRFLRRHDGCGLVAYAGLHCAIVEPLTRSRGPDRFPLRAGRRRRHVTLAVSVFGWLLSMPIRDLSTGYRLYHCKVLTSLNPVARDFDFLQEVLILVYSQAGP